MTRINCVPVTELTVKHLVAEYRELPRVFGLVRAAQAREVSPSSIKVDAYTMGKGHVRFFFTRLRWVERRHRELVEEMLRRGYSPNYLNPPSHDISSEWFGDWEPSERDLAINRARITERLTEPK